MKASEIEKSKVLRLDKEIEYDPKSVVIRTIIKKTTGNVNLVAIDKGEIFNEKISAFDTFIQIIEGNAEVVIDEKSNFLKTGEVIIIPAHTAHNIKAEEKTKIISTIIKNGYEVNSI